MTNFQVRKKFIDFFKKREHKILPSSPICIHSDSSLLFVNAGMNQFKNVFLSLTEPPAKNVVTIQQCLRAGGKHNDLEMVGETPLHHTFFEMLGNFSFGGYFKKKAIALAWEFLNQELGLDENKLWITVHKKDEESYHIWRDQQKIPANKIYRLGDKDNFWKMGDTGPCGYCSEIHYYTGKEDKPNYRQFMEIWNLVFMEFNDLGDEKREKLLRPCVDTGMGLERLCAVLQAKKSNYHTDLFKEVILDLQKDSGLKYDFEQQTVKKDSFKKKQLESQSLTTNPLAKKHIKENPPEAEKQKAFRVLADHSRAVTFLIYEGLYPGSSGAEYVLRRIMRRAFYYGWKLNKQQILLRTGVKKVIELMSKPPKEFLSNGFLDKNLGYYPDLKKDEPEIQSCIKREAGQFLDIIEEGEKEWEKLKKFKLSKGKKELNAKDIWNLFSTYGLPIELTQLKFKEWGWLVAGEQEIKQYREQVKKNIIQGLFHVKKEQIKKHVLAQLKPEERKTKWTAYQKQEEEGKIIGLTFVKQTGDFSAEESPVVTMPNPTIHSFGDSINDKNQGYVIMDKTCFYPEGGGPIGDRGFLFIKANNKKQVIAKVLDCQKVGETILHEVEFIAQNQSITLKKGETLFLKVPQNFREGIKSAHTATHLLNSALRNELGGLVRQAGSLVEPGVLRFDFTHPKALTTKEIENIENQINQSINKQEKLSLDFKSLSEAKKEGALFLKAENYDPEEVRVITIGKNTSKELCGGIHVQNTKEIKSFKIVSEKGVQSGVRRIVAYTHFVAKAWEAFLKQQNKELREYLKIPLIQESVFKQNDKAFYKGLIEQQNPFLSWIQNKEKELKNLRKQIVQLGITDPAKGTSSSLQAFKLNPNQTKKEAFQNSDFNQGKTKKEPLQSLKPNPNKAKNPPLQEFVEVCSFFHPLALQSLQLRQYLNLPLIDSKILTNSFTKQTEKTVAQTAEKLFQEKLESPLAWLQNKQKELQKQKTELDKIKTLDLTKEKLLKKAKSFKAGGIEGKLLLIDLPLQDRKTLSDISDVLLLNLFSGLVILSGTDKNKHPIVVNRTKNFEKILSAGDILKNKVAPFCKGKGGGKDSYAQGSISDKSAFFQLESVLLDHLNQL